MKRIILALNLILIFFLSDVYAQNALSFDGTDDGVNCGTDTAFDVGGTAFTLEAWIYATSWPTNIYEGTIVNKENNSNNGGYMLRAGSGGKLGFGIGAGTNGAWSEINTSTAVLSLNTWHHVATTYDGTKMRAYVDGTLVDSNSTTISTGISNTTPLTIGYNPTYGRRWSGSIDEVRIWNSVRTPAELNANKDDEFCGATSNLRAYYKFDHGTASGNNTGINTATDFSGFNNTASLQSFALTGSTSNWVSGAGLDQDSVTSMDTISSCGPFFHSPSQTFYTASTTYTASLNTTYGCDSSVVTEIIITNSKSTMSAAACDSFIGPSGKIYRSSGTFFDILTGAGSNGCDSIITLELQVGAVGTEIDTSVCYTYTTPNSMNTYTTSGTYYDTAATIQGCDSIIKVNLEVKGATYSSDTYSTCDSIISPSGKWLLANNTYTDTIVNSKNCDSIITITVNSLITYDTAYPSVCYTYTSPTGKVFNTSGEYLDSVTNRDGCHHIITLHLTVSEATSETISIEGCRVATTENGSHSFETSGTYKDTLVNSQGCDSFLTITATVNNVTATATLGDRKITANTTGDIQWLDCDDSYSIISGETNMTFTPTANGTYAAQVTENNCLDTSECLSILNLGIDDISAKFNVFPNPSNGNVTIDLGNMNGLYNLSIVDINGRVVQDMKDVAGIQTFNLDSGVYLIKVTGDSGMGSKRIVVTE
jgi:hypothetical protein